MNRTDTQEALEQVLRRSRFTDKVHKEALRGRLFGRNNSAHADAEGCLELSPEELEMAAGGKQDPMERIRRKWT